jgi:hypothetical protein
MSESILDGAVAEPTRRHKLPIGWFVVTGVLVVALVIVLIAGGVHGAKSAARHRAALKTAVHTAAMQKGLSLARAFRNIDPELMRKDGQAKVTSLFSALLQDPEINSVVFYGPDGGVRASSNLKFSGQRADSKLLNAVEAECREDAQGILASGPIFDANGERLGAVTITLVEKATE